jgi:hypothetical protein
MSISTIHGMWEWAWILANEEEASRFRVSAKMHTVNNVGLGIQDIEYLYVQNFACMFIN